MTQCIETYLTEITEAKFSNPLLYIQKEGESYYQIEDEYIFPKMINSAVFQDFVEELKSYKHPLTGLRNLTRNYCKHFQVDHIKIKQTNNNNGDSFYFQAKKAIFLHSSLITDINKHGDDHYYDVLVLTFLHELAHAYTEIFYDRKAFHNNVYLINVIRLFSFFINEKESFFYDEKFEDNDIEICKPLKNALKKQIFLTGNSDYITQSFFYNEAELEKYIDLFAEKIKDEELKKNKLGQTISLEYTQDGHISYYRVLNKNNIDLMTMVVSPKDSGYLVFEFNRLKLLLDELEQINFFKDNNQSIPSNIKNNPYKKYL